MVERLFPTKEYLDSGYLSPAVNSQDSRSAGCQPRYLDSRYLSPAANSQVTYLYAMRFIEITYWTGN